MSALNAETRCGHGRSGATVTSRVECLALAVEAWMADGCNDTERATIAANVRALASAHPVLVQVFGRVLAQK
jgi:hypothetical protein